MFFADPPPGGLFPLFVTFFNLKASLSYCSCLTDLEWVDGFGLDLDKNLKKNIMTIGC